MSLSENKLFYRNNMGPSCTLRNVAPVQFGSECNTFIDLRMFGPVVLHQEHLPFGFVLCLTN